MDDELICWGGVGGGVCDGIDLAGEIFLLWLKQTFLENGV